MRKYFGLTALIATLALGGCSTKVDNVVESVPRAEIRMIGDFSEPSVTRSSSKNNYDGAAIAGQTADSLQITRIRTLVRDIKLHEMETDLAGAHRTFKSAPTILVAGADTAYTITTQFIDPRSYDEVKLEVRKLNEREAQMLKSDTNYRDFLTAERPTIIVEGVVFNNGNGEKFTFKTDAAASITALLQPPLHLKEWESGLIALRYDPFVIFKNGNHILDPRDNRNKPHFDAMIQNAIRSLKR